MRKEALRKSVKSFAISQLGAGFALFLFYKIGFLHNVQAYFDGGSQPGGSIGSALLAALSALIAGGVVWFAERKAKKFSFGESIILLWTIFMAISYWFAAREMYGVPVVVVSTTLLTSTIALYAARSVWEEDSREKLVHAFKSYVSPELVSQIERDPTLLTITGERKELTILFSDIQNFTSLSERISAEELTSILNRYLGGVTEIIFRHGGTLDKYIGDGVMAFWNAPTAALNHRHLAAVAAQEIASFSKKFFEELNAPSELSLRTRIGLNSGEAIVGNFGSKVRFSYTAIGDEPNLAARLEGLNGKYDTDILMSETTAKGFEGDGAIFVDEVRVKGKANSVKIYTFWNGTSTARQQFVQSYQAAFEIYRRGDFLTAKSLFEILSVDHPAQMLLKTLVERCRQCIAVPPANWDGIYSFSEKS